MSYEIIWRVNKQIPVDELIPWLYFQAQIINDPIPTDRPRQKRLFYLTLCLAESPTNSFLVTSLSKRGAATPMVFRCYFKCRLQFSNCSHILGIISSFESRAFFHYYCQIAGDSLGPIVINALRNGFRDPGDLVHNSWSFCSRISMVRQKLIFAIWYLMRFDITGVFSNAILLLITHLQFFDMRSSRKYLVPL
jgi:hypothetical protein